MNNLHFMFAVALGLAATASSALMPGTSDPLITVTRNDFPMVPRVLNGLEMHNVCGGGVTAEAVYCTTDQTIYVGFTVLDRPRNNYILAHLFGHGLQVQYGIADFALAAIRAEPEREAALRGMVERQNDCFAGMLLARAGEPLPDILTLFENDPLAGAHWGRSPVRNGPVRHMPLADRAEWLEIGYRAGVPDACDVGEVSADLIVAVDPR